MVTPKIWKIVLPATSRRAVGRGIGQRIQGRTSCLAQILVPKSRGHSRCFLYWCKGQPWTGTEKAHPHFWTLLSTLLPCFQMTGFVCPKSSIFPCIHKILSILYYLKLSSNYLNEQVTRIRELSILLQNHFQSQGEFHRTQMRNSLPSLESVCPLLITLDRVENRAIHWVELHYQNQKNKTHKW